MKNIRTAPIIRLVFLAFAALTAANIIHAADAPKSSLAELRAVYKTVDLTERGGKRVDTCEEIVQRLNKHARLP